MHNPIIVALDVPTADAALALAHRLGSAVGAFKIGKELFTAAGPDVVRRIRALGAPVFLDLKFHDIPNTVAKAVAAAVHLDVQMLTVHASGGSAMLQAAESAAREAAERLHKPPPLVLAVTVLTSLDATALAELGLPPDVEAHVERLAALAARAGIRGLVCSPLELPTLRRLLPHDMQLVTPGIRPASAPADDQRRTMTPLEAMQAGANWLVVGRPITAAADPAAAAHSLLQSIQPTGPR
jgi:orotidine-5'-phosphate decarboxylase